MSVEILKAVLEEAYGLTASLPESVQEIAFAKTFDVLLEEHEIAIRRARRSKLGQPQTGQSGGRLRRSPSRSRRVGPKLALSQLIDGAYFTSSRSLPEIQSHLRDSFGRDYGSNELSISLLRLIRDGRLSREKNLAGQYEYRAEDQREESLRTQTLRQAKPNTRLLTDGRER